MILPAYHQLGSRETKSHVVPRLPAGNLLVLNNEGEMSGESRQMFCLSTRRGKESHAWSYDAVKKQL